MGGNIALFYTQNSPARYQLLHVKSQASSYIQCKSIDFFYLQKPKRELIKPPP
ncbi:hypothetical protein KFK09_004643 [Dendrobium nobile]|uniref:Uncharacterized protein n=1 Tax=Dendrobium nobile TaxID=94219 RepID=A0A8T3C4L3_DENNO|nr:hypothetical protein KFK09_004643 [Dendrobium nobile]